MYNGSGPPDSWKGPNWRGPFPGPGSAGDPEEQICSTLKLAMPYGTPWLIAAVHSTVFCKAKTLMTLQALAGT